MAPTTATVLAAALAAAALLAPAAGAPASPSAGGSLGTLAEGDRTGVQAELAAWLQGKVPPGTGIAVVAADPGFEFRTDIWWDFRRVGDISASNALLVPPDTLIRYIPPKYFNGQASFTFKAWDQTFGAPLSRNGTDTRSSAAFSAGTAAATVTVTAVNDPPYVASKKLVAYFDGGAGYISLGKPKFGGEISIELWAYIEDPYRPWIRFVEFAGPNTYNSNNVAFGMADTTGRMFLGLCAAAQ